MRHLLTFSIFAAIATFIMSCNSKSTMPGAGELDSDSVEVSAVADTAIYGTVDESTTMHMLTINMENGKQQTFAMNLDTLGSDIQGGIFAGDKVTLTATNGEDGMQVVKCVNLSTLLGKWTSLDRNFQIEENGVHLLDPRLLHGLDPCDPPGRALRVPQPRRVGAGLL